MTVFFCFSACSKDNFGIHKNDDLKTKSLPQLKAFLNGKWKLHYAYKDYFYGLVKEDYESAESMITFYPQDSIKWISEVSHIIAVQDKIIYTWGKNSYNDYAYNLSFYDAGVGYSYNWTPDKVINDTLVFVDNSVVGSSYYLTKKE